MKPSSSPQSDSSPKTRFITPIFRHPECRRIVAEMEKNLAWLYREKLRDRGGAGSWLAWFNRQTEAIDFQIERARQDRRIAIDADAVLFERTSMEGVSFLRRSPDPGAPLPEVNVEHAFSGALVGAFESDIELCNRAKAEALATLDNARDLIAPSRMPGISKQDMPAKEGL